MPLWQIYHPPSTYQSQESKALFASDITKIYTNHGLPSFYVVVNFIPTPPETLFVGGQTKTPSENPFIRIVITHIAVHVPDNDEAYKRTTARIDAVLKTHVSERGYEWEYHVDETERRLWKINGMRPPEWKSEEERLWVRENRAVPYDGM